MRYRATLVFIALLLPGACTQVPAQTSSVLHPAKESPAMPSPDTPVTVGQPAMPSPKLTAEQMLTRLLALIRTSKGVDEFTPQHLSEVMGVDLKYASDGSGRYGFGEKVTQHWRHGFEVNMKKTNPGLEFNFDPVVRDSSPAMTDICQIDFDRFTDELEAMGFVRQHYYDSPPPAPFNGERLPHGRLMYDSFERPGMWVQVYPRGEANEPHEKISHLCVEMILVG